MGWVKKIPTLTMDFAASIQVDIESVAEYRKNAVEFLKTN